MLAGLSDVTGEQPAVSPLLTPQAIGQKSELEPQADGTLYLKLNLPASALAKSQGDLKVTIRAK
jgi:hypothetical protein